jgi:hypothetical protein
MSADLINIAGEAWNHGKHSISYSCRFSNLAPRFSSYGSTRRWQRINKFHCLPFPYFNKLPHRVSFAFYQNSARSLTLRADGAGKDEFNYKLHQRPCRWDGVRNSCALYSSEEHRSLWGTRRRVGKVLRGRRGSLCCDNTEIRI